MHTDGPGAMFTPQNLFRVGLALVAGCTTEILPDAENKAGTVPDGLRHEVREGWRAWMEQNPETELELVVLQGALSWPLTGCRSTSCTPFLVARVGDRTIGRSAASRWHNGQYLMTAGDSLGKLALDELGQLRLEVRNSAAGSAGTPRTEDLLRTLTLAFDWEQLQFAMASSNPPLGTLASSQHHLPLGLRPTSVHQVNVNHNCDSFQMTVDQQLHQLGATHRRIETRGGRPGLPARQMRVAGVVSAGANRPWPIELPQMLYPWTDSIDIPDYLCHRQLTVTASGLRPLLESAFPYVNVMLRFQNGDLAWVRSDWRYVYWNEVTFPFDEAPLAEAMVTSGELRSIRFAIDNDHYPFANFATCEFEPPPELPRHALLQDQPASCDWANTRLSFKLF